MKKQKPGKQILFFGVILILVLVMFYSGLQILESTVFRSPQEDGTIASKTVIRDGVKYFPRQDITIVMLIGVDQYGEVTPSLGYQNAGLADMISLLIFDEREQNCRVLALNRDTMLEMPVLGIGGKVAGTAFGQLALSHTYGTGMEDSCENTRNAVSKFLHDLSIDYYVAMNMDAISILNDAVGGVTVTVSDDFSEINPDIPMGEVTLMGKQAIDFVRSRSGVGNQLNVSRMERQKAYMQGFMTSLHRSMQEGAGFGLSTYETVSPYLVSDCSWNVINSLMNRYKDYEIVEVVSPAGRNVAGAEYYEFYVDEASLDDLILRLFYAPK